MFSRRQQQVLQTILSYAAANVDHINREFAVDTDMYPDKAGCLAVNGDIYTAVTDEEIKRLRNLLKG
jgi:hypothetical protein